MRACAHTLRTNATPYRPIALERSRVEYSCSNSGLGTDSPSLLATLNSSPRLSRHRILRPSVILRLAWAMSLVARTHRPTEVRVLTLVDAGRPILRSSFRTHVRR